MDTPQPLTKGISHPFLVVLFFSVFYILFFSSVLFNSLLAPGDGLLYHVAFFESKKLLWDPMLANGFPMAADPQVLTWYPPAIIFSFVPGGWNAFVIFAYVIASCFTYGYIYTIMRSHLAALVGGIVYGMCAFMMAHLGHTTIIHSAAWLPLIVWSLEKLRHDASRLWFVVGCVAVACCVLAGHLQIVSYSLLLSAAYASLLGWNAAVGRWRFYSTAALLLLLGLGFAALQILPASELAQFSARANFSFDDFVSYSLPFTHLLLVIFPAAFGGLPRYGEAPYFGEWNLTEMAAYVGLLPLMLAPIGAVVYRRNAVAMLWLGAVIVTLLLALGDRTPLALLSYYLPIIGKFRAPARHVFELAFACSVLAGFGVDAIIRGRVSRRLILLTLLTFTAVILIALLSFVFGPISELARLRGVESINLRPWSNAALGIPLLVFFTAAVALWYWHRNAKSSMRQTLLLTVLVFDLGSFGWFYSWYLSAPPKSALQRPSLVTGYRNSLQQTNQRMLSVRGTKGTLEELPPNLSRLWEMPAATSYGPLSLARVNEMLSMLPDASVAPGWKDADDQSLNLAAVRYVIMPRTSAKPDKTGMSWADQNLNVVLGPHCNSSLRDSVKLELPPNRQANAIALVTRLTCAVPLVDNEEVARIMITDANGAVETLSLRAGQHTAEWTHDSEIVKSQVRHRRPDIFESFAATMNGQAYEAHNYRAMLKLSSLRVLKSIEVRWTGSAGSLVIEKLNLLDESTGRSEPVSPLAADNSRWRFAGESDAAHVYENLYARPRAWLVSEAITLKPDEILKAIKSSKLPDGSPFRAEQTVLVEEELHVGGGSTVAATAILEQLAPTTVQVKTSSATDSFLITSDTWYPGWQATIDGAPVPIFRANYALRGVSVPAGAHVVKFEFRPKFFYFGVALSVLSVLVLSGILTLPNPLFGGRFNKLTEAGKGP